MPNITPLQQAINLFEQGEVDTALEDMQQVLISQPTNPLVRVEFANMLMRSQRFEDAKDVLDSLSEDDKKNQKALALYSQLESIEVVISAPDIDSLLDSINSNSNDSLAREQLCAHYILRGDFPAAMNQLLEIIKTDQTYKEGFARNQLIKTFDLIASDIVLVKEYRKKLSLLLN
ncbi:MAG: tetratricopeptide repeat protein [Woeseiaceae bacterium]